MPTRKKQLPSPIDAFLDGVLARAIVKLRRAKLTPFTFAFYHDHESRALSVCVDTFENSARFLSSWNASKRAYFLEAIEIDDLEDAASWQPSFGHSTSLGDFAKVNVARTDLPRGMRTAKPFYLAMIRAVLRRERDIATLAHDPRQLLFCCSGTKDEVEFTWMAAGDAA
jgi:hypothetical protein